MANAGHIIVPPGLVPIHSFDMYGPIVDSWILGEEQVRLFQEVSRRENLNPSSVERIISDYRALNKGESWATGLKKPEIIDALKKPIDRHPDLQPNYQAALYADILDTFKNIVAVGERILIFSTRKQKWINDYLQPVIGEIEIPQYEGNKAKPETFQAAYEQELALGRRIVTHTADELPELEAAVASGIFSGEQGKTIFVDRNNTISNEQARAAGIDFYVSSPKEVPYSRLVSRI